MVRFVASGVPFVPPDIEEFIAIAIKHHGNVRAIAAYLNLTPITLYTYFKKDPKAKEIIDEVRGYNSFSDLDIAEHVNRYNMMNYKEKPALAQRAAEFTLITKGKDRGWIHKQNEDNLSLKEEEKSLTKSMDLVSYLQSKSDLNNEDSNIINEQ